MYPHSKTAIILFLNVQFKFQYMYRKFSTPFRFKKWSCSYHFATKKFIFLLEIQNRFKKNKQTSQNTLPVTVNSEKEKKKVIER